MVYAAPPRRARDCFAARGGLCGGDGIPELTSGTPPGPERPRSVLEAREGGRGADGVAGG
jgi:hypothetical protein